MRAFLLLLTAAIGLAGAAVASQMPDTPEGEEPAFYLPAGSFDILKVLPPPPREGSPRSIADRQIFRQTRSLVGTPRWQLAVNDVQLEPADMMRDFSCAVGVSLNPENAPMTAQLMERAGSDTARMTGIAKGFYKRPQPYLNDEGETCQPKAELQASYDYPSGHTTAGWTWAVLLAQIAPDRASDILARGRAFGDSRIVCGMHNASSVEAGRLSASATLAALARAPTFQSHVVAASEEMKALRRRAGTLRPDPAQCDRERALVAQPVF